MVANSSGDSDSQPSEEEIRRDIAQVIASIGHSPSKAEYEEHGTYDADHIERVSGEESWESAISSFGGTSRGSTGKIPDSKLREDVHRVVDMLDSLPSRADYNRLGDYSSQTVINRFDDGSWPAALEKLGYDVEDWTSVDTKITKGDLKRDVERVTTKIGRPPTYSEYDELGEYASETISERFGDETWTDALEELGYGIEEIFGTNQNISDKSLKRDIAQVSKQLGRPPTPPEYNQYGEHWASNVIERFGDETWTDALEELGYDSDKMRGQNFTIPDETLKQDVKKVRDELGHPPTISEYNSHGEYSHSTISNRFGNGSWSAALEKLGYDIGERNTSRRISDEKLERDINQVAEELGHPPNTSEYRELGVVSPQTVSNRFGDGSWPAALEELGYDVESESQSESVSREELKSDFDRVVEKLGHTPSPSEYTEHGDYTIYKIRKEFLDDDQLNRWSNILENLGYEE